MATAAPIAALPGFLVVSNALKSIPSPLINKAVTVTALAEITGSASGGMDSLPHNVTVITVLAITRLPHRQAYKDVFAITLIKSLAVPFIIAVYYMTGIV